jgi:hypothetical protein
MMKRTSQRVQKGRRIDGPQAAQPVAELSVDSALTPDAIILGKRKELQRELMGKKQAVLEELEKATAERDRYVRLIVELQFSASAIEKQMDWKLRFQDRMRALAGRPQEIRESARSVRSQYTCTLTKER